MARSRSRSRVLNGLALVCLGLGLALTGLVVASGWYSFAWKSRGAPVWGLDGGHGAIRYLYRPQFPGTPGLEITRDGDFALGWRPRGVYVRRSFLVYAHGVHMHYGWDEEWEELFVWPLPLALFAMAAGCRWRAWRGARRFAAGACPECGYDLRGVPAGVGRGWECPECGLSEPEAQARGKREGSPGERPA